MANPVIEGRVEEIGQTQKGSRKLKIGGEWYFEGRTNTSDVLVGDMLQVEYNTFGEHNNLRGIQGWNKVGGIADKSAPVPRFAPKEGAPAPTPQPTASVVLLEGERIYCCALVQAAIGAGKVQDPSELTKWAQGAYESLQAIKALASAPDRPRF
jgi:hypothetical protein